MTDSIFQSEMLQTLLLMNAIFLLARSHIVDKNCDEVQSMSIMTRKKSQMEQLTCRCDLVLLYSPQSTPSVIKTTGSYYRLVGSIRFLLRDTIFL